MLTPLAGLATFHSVIFPLNLGCAVPSLGYLSGAPRVSTRPDAELVGPRSHVLGVMQAYESLGWEVQPYIVGDKVPASWVTAGSGSAVRTSGLRSLAIDGLRMVLGLGHAAGSWVSLRGRVDAVYERSGLFQAMGAPFAASGIPWILETNAIQYKEAAGDRNSLALKSVARAVERWAYRTCDVLVVISEALRDEVIEEGVAPEKIAVVPNGVDVHQFDPASTEPRRYHDAFTVGFVGALSEWQALDRLFHAIRRLRDDGLDIAATIVGDGAARANWEALVTDLDLDAAVTFTGRVEHRHVPRLIAGFDVGYSGPLKLSAGSMYLSPLKLYEYLAMQTPIVAAAYEDARRMAAGGGAAYLFEPGNDAGLENALRRAYQEPEDARQAQGRQARKAIVREHSWTARVRALNQTVRHHLSGSTSF